MKDCTACGQRVRTGRGDLVRHLRFRADGGAPEAAVYGSVAGLQGKLRCGGHRARQSQSPYRTPSDPPFLLIHGERDRTVDVTSRAWPRPMARGRPRVRPSTSRMSTTVSSAAGPRSRARRRWRRRTRPSTSSTGSWQGGPVNRADGFSASGMGPEFALIGPLAGPCRRRVTHRRRVGRRRDPGLGCACLAGRALCGATGSRAALAGAAAGGALERCPACRPRRADVPAGAAFTHDESLLRQRGHQRRLPLPERVGAGARREAARDRVDLRRRLQCRLRQHGELFRRGPRAQRRRAREPGVPGGRARLPRASGADTRNPATAARATTDHGPDRGPAMGAAEHRGLRRGSWQRHHRRSVRRFMAVSRCCRQVPLPAGCFTVWSA